MVAVYVLLYIPCKQTSCTHFPVFSFTDQHETQLQALLRFNDHLTAAHVDHKTHGTSSHRRAWGKDARKKLRKSRVQHSHRRAWGKDARKKN